MRHNPRAEADRLVDVGIAAASDGRPGDAIAAYTKAIQVNPLSLDGHMNLGNLLAQYGKQRQAVVHLQRAMSLAAGHPKASEDAATSFLHLGRWDLALPILNRLNKADPKNAMVLANLGFLHLENGRREEAIAAAARAVEIDPSLAAAHFLLYFALYDDRNVTASIAPLKAAVKWAPEKDWYRFLLGVLLDESGDRQGSRKLFTSLGPDSYAGGRESWAYIKEKRTPSTRIFSTTRQTLLAGVESARPDGLSLEFGVRYGISTRWLAERCDVVHGFDSFEGLPEVWHIQSKGAFSTHGDRPELPPNVKLHVGWFDATIPVFAQDYAGPVRFMNIDCDLYSSTKVVFDQLSSRIGPGTVLVFDEYIINDRWRQDEFKAFQEAVVEHGWRYEYLAFSVTNFQATVRIL